MDNLKFEGMFVEMAVAMLNRDFPEFKVYINYKTSKPDIFNKGVYLKVRNDIVIDYYTYCQQKGCYINDE